MPLDNPRHGGLGWAEGFKGAGYPWVTGSVAIASDATHTIHFTNMTKFFIVSNRGTVPLRIGFTLNGISGSNFYAVDPGEERELNLKIRDLYLKNTGSLGGVYDLIAGISEISRDACPIMSGSTTPNTGSMYVPNIG